MARLAKFSGTSSNLSREMGAPDSKNSPPLEN
jgi:hypothetical protein